VNILLIIEENVVRNELQEYKDSAKAKVLIGGPMILLVVALVEDVAHGLLLHRVLLLQHAHLVELHLSEERLLLLRLPRLRTLRLAGHLLVQRQLRAVQAQSHSHLLRRNCADVLLLRANARDLLVEVVGLHGNHLLEDLG
jgi:hypothetical protein